MTIPATAFKEKYNARLLDIIETFKAKFPKVGPQAQVFIDYYYISKVDEDALHPTAEDAAQNVIKKAKEHLSAATVTFHPIGALKLWVQIQRRPPRNRPLQFTELMETPEGRAWDWQNFVIFLFSYEMRQLAKYLNEFLIPTLEVFNRTRR